MKKPVRIFDIIFIPLWFVSFIISYLWFIIQAGYASAEYWFDPETFEKKYKVGDVKHG